MLIPSIYITSSLPRIFERPVTILSNQNGRWQLPKPTKNHSKTSPKKYRRNFKPPQGGYDMDYVPTLPSLSTLLLTVPAASG